MKNIVSVDKNNVNIIKSINLFRGFLMLKRYLLLRVERGLIKKELFLNSSTTQSIRILHQVFLAMSNKRKALRTLFVESWRTVLKLTSKVMRKARKYILITLFIPTSIREWMSTNKCSKLSFSETSLSRRSSLRQTWRRNTKTSFYLQFLISSGLLSTVIPLLFKWNEYRSLA